MTSINNITDKAVIFYLYAIIPASLLTGFLLRSGLTIAGLTPSLFLSVFILISLSLYFLITAIEYRKIHRYIAVCIILFIFLPIAYLFVHGFRYFTDEYNFSLTITVAVFIIIYISYYSRLNTHVLYTAIHYINIMLIANIILSWLLDVGYPSYISSGREIGTKGFLYGGNTASLLSIAVLCFYLFDNNFKKIYWKWIIVTLALTSAILTQTISSIVAPLILAGYLITKSKYRYPLLILLIMVITLSSNLIYQKAENYLDSNYRFQRITDIDEYSAEYRRFHDSYLQLEYNINNPISFIVGTGRSGQISFWNREIFRFSGMDISDLIMRYGIIGFIYIIFIFLLPLLKYIYLFKIDHISTSAFFIFLYGMFGGYLFSSITALVYLSVLIAYVKIKIKYHEIG